MQPAPQNVKDNQNKEKQKNVGDVVTLNVGGVLYTTTLGTLCAEPGSMLAAMFSGRHTIVTDKDGNPFLDRDGQSFKHILNYLRTGIVPANLSMYEQDMLQQDADYYAIESLARKMKEKDNPFALPTANPFVQQSSSTPEVNPDGILIPTIEPLALQPKPNYAVLHYDWYNKQRTDWGEGSPEPIWITVNGRTKDAFRPPAKNLVQILVEMEQNGWKLYQSITRGSEETELIFRKEPF